MPRVFAITGASSSGKTTLISHFERLGYPVVHEVAREIIAEGALAPKTLEFQRETTKRHLLRETALRASAKKMIFTDRGIYDGLGYCNYFGFAGIPEILQSKINYDAAFFLEPVGDLGHDGIRFETDLTEALAIKDSILQAYLSRGIPCINVPALEVAKRAEYVLSHLPEINQKPQMS